MFLELLTLFLTPGPQPFQKYPPKPVKSYECSVVEPTHNNRHAHLSCKETASYDAPWEAEVVK